MNERRLIGLCFKPRMATWHTVRRGCCCASQQNPIGERYKRVIRARFRAMQSGHPSSAMRSIGTVLLNDFVGAREQRRRHLDAERLGGGQIDDYS
jgi:hypothetical protein